MGTGSYALTGNTIGINVSYLISIAAGVFSLVGQALTFGSPLWTRQTKNTSSMTNQSKNSSSWTNGTKNTSTMTNETKH
jgi:hypothetical protein